MSRNREIPEVNAGSMADIAFLLLIFFLVATAIETDLGLFRKLPPKDQDVPIIEINERNVLRVVLNKNDELMVEQNILDIRDLRRTTKDFLDNGGAVELCSYCEGQQLATSSDSPTKAVVVLGSDRNASYGAYVQVQNELSAAYNDLRNREALKFYGMTFTDLEKAYSSAEISVEARLEVAKKIKQIREMYPLRISEAETNPSQS